MQSRRPQEPIPPYPYHHEEVFYKNDKAAITLAGTLTMPRKQGVFPAVLLIAGHGPKDRDATGRGHRLFLVLADYLTQHGFASLRFDKRGIGASTGDFATATCEDFASDARAAIAYLKTRTEIDRHNIGVVGWSEGGLVALMAAAQSPDIACAVLMAPALTTHIDDLLYHAALQLRADGASQEFIERDYEVRKKIYTIAQKETVQQRAQQMIQDALAAYMQSMSDSDVHAAAKLPIALAAQKSEYVIQELMSPAYRFFLHYDPAPLLEKITIPVLALCGDHDWIASAHTIFPVLKRAFEKNGNTLYTLQEIPHLNHGFQTCHTGSSVESETIEETMSPFALKLISDWLTKQLE